MITPFQPSTQTPASTLLIAASRIVAASTLALGDYHDATVEIVAQALAKLSVADADDFVAHGCDPTIAAEIIDAALTDTETGSDTMATMATMSASTSATLRDMASPVAAPAMETTPAKMMLTMIKQIMLPMAERLVELEGRLT